MCPGCKGYLFITLSVNGISIYKLDALCHLELLFVTQSVKGSSLDESFHAHCDEHCITTYMQCPDHHNLKKRQFHPGLFKNLTPNVAIVQ